MLVIALENILLAIIFRILDRNTIYERAAIYKL